MSWSDELYRIYGFEPQSRSITLEFFLSCLHPADRERVQREVGAALERGERFAYPERIVRPDGRIRRLDTIGEAVRDAEGHVTGLIGTCRDVTEEHERDETIQVYADIVRNMQIGVAVFEVGNSAAPETFRLVTFNPEAERAARKPLNDQIGKTLFEVLPYAEGGPLPALLSAVARDGQVRQVVQERARNPSHPDRAVAMKAFPLPGGRVGLAVEDITTQTRIQRVQAAAHGVLERIVAGESLPNVLAALVTAIEENLPFATATMDLVDAAGNPTMTIVSPGSKSSLDGMIRSSAPNRCDRRPQPRHAQPVSAGRKGTDARAEADAAPRRLPVGSGHRAESDGGATAGAVGAPGIGAGGRADRHLARDPRRARDRR